MTRDVAAVLLSGDLRSQDGQPLMMGRGLVSANNERQDNAWQSFFGEVCADRPRAVQPIKSEAKKVGTSPERLKERSQALAMAIHCCIQVY